MHREQSRTYEIISLLCIFFLHIRLGQDSDCSSRFQVRRLASPGPAIGSHDSAIPQAQEPAGAAWPTVQSLPVSH